MARNCDRCGEALTLGNHLYFNGQHVCRACLVALDPAAEPTPVVTGRPLATRPARLVAQLIDGLVTVALYTAGFLGSSLLGPAGEWMIPAGIVAGLGYFLFSDGLRGGQSLGKRVMKIRVVDAENSNPCSYLQSLGRNFTAVLGFIDWLFIFEKSRRRLGDRLASTIVVEAGSGPISPAPPPA